jgi:hypothetical protein
MNDTKLIMESWRKFCSEEKLLEEIKVLQDKGLVLEKLFLEGRATWGDLANFVAGADPKTWRNRLKKVGKGAGKMVAAAGLTAGAVVLAPKIMAALGIAAAGPKIAEQLFKLLGDDVQTWTQDKMQDALEEIGTGIGTFISSEAIMGALDKLTKGTPLARLNITDAITNIVDKKYEEEFYTFMNQWFKQHPGGPTNNPDEVIPKRWADRMFNNYIQKKHGVSVGVNLSGGGEVDPGAQG